MKIAPKRTLNDLHVDNLPDTVALSSFKLDGIVTYSVNFPQDLLKCLLEQMTCLASSAPASIKGQIHCPRHRADVPLPDTPEVQSILSIVVKATAPLLYAYLGTNASLMELSLLVAYPGCVVQPLHPDSERADDKEVAKLVTIFIPLQDISRAMGPLQVSPGSHNMEEEEISLDTLVNMTVSVGTLIAMDSCVYHRGADNFSNQPRYVMYASFLGEGIEPKGPTWTIRSDLIGHYTLRDFETCSV